MLHTSGLTHCASVVFFFYMMNSQVKSVDDATQLNELVREFGLEVLVYTEEGFAYIIFVCSKDKE